jgi:hypothetical protein
MRCRGTLEKMFRKEQIPYEVGLDHDRSGRRRPWTGIRILDSGRVWHLPNFLVDHCGLRRQVGSIFFVILVGVQRGRGSAGVRAATGLKRLVVVYRRDCVRGSALVVTLLLPSLNRAS